MHIIAYNLVSCFNVFTYLLIQYENFHRLVIQGYRKQIFPGSAAEFTPSKGRLSKTIQDWKSWCPSIKEPKQLANILKKPWSFTTARKCIQVKRTFLTLNNDNIKVQVLVSGPYQTSAMESTFSEASQVQQIRLHLRGQCLYPSPSPSALPDNSNKTKKKHQKDMR